MFQTLKQLFAPTNKDLRKRILFTLGALMIFVIGTSIRVPGTDEITKNLGFIIVDYIKCTLTRGMESSQYDELGNLAIELKTIAGTLNLPILTGGQLLPNTERLADSSKIERYISTMCIWTPKTAEEKVRDGVKQGNFRMRITKNRNGKITEDECYLNFVVDGNTSSIYEAKEFEHRPEDAMPY